MGVTSKLLDLWDVLGGEEPRSRKGLSISLDPSGFVTEIRDYRRPNSLHSDTATLQDAMSGNELVFACLDIKATAAQDPRLLVQKVVKQSGGKVEYEEDQGHAFRQLIMRPNPMMTEADLMRAAIISWDISNPRRFYCEKEYEGKLLKYIWPLNPACMRLLPSRVDPSKNIGYVWSDGIERREYAFDEILVRAGPAWYNPSPTVAALRAIESDSAQTDYVRTFFENGGIPPGILKYKNVRLNQTQRDEVRDKWRSIHGNAYGKQFDIGVLDAEVDYQQTGSKLDELQSQVLRSVAESRVCMVYKVPPLIIYAYVGLMRATYANLKEAYEGFWSTAMSPAFRELRDFWTWNLLTEFEYVETIKKEQIRLNYDMSQVVALQDDVDAMAARNERAWRAGGITRAEYRAKIGEQPGPNDNFYILPAGSQVVFADERPTAVVTVSPLKTKAKATPPSLAIIERRMEKAVQGYLHEQYMLAAAAVGG